MGIVDQAKVENAGPASLVPGSGILDVCHPGPVASVQWDRSSICLPFVRNKLRAINWSVPQPATIHIFPVQGRSNLLMVGVMTG